MSADSLRKLSERELRGALSQMVAPTVAEAATLSPFAALPRSVVFVCILPSPLARFDVESLCSDCSSPYPGHFLYRSNVQCERRSACDIIQMHRKLEHAQMLNAVSLSFPPKADPTAAAHKMYFAHLCSSRNIICVQGTRAEIDSITPPALVGLAKILIDCPLRACPKALVRNGYFSKLRVIKA